jgi:HK97 family phage major capsid protein
MPVSRRARGNSEDGWYRINNLANGPTQILIYSEIGFWGVTAQDFIRDLGAVSGPVEVKINSPGGDVFDAFAIYQALASRPGVTTIVDSLAASAASVIAMAGEQRLMAKTSQLMIHDAWTVSDGNADDLRHMAGRLDITSAQIAGVYADAAGGSADDWREQMRAETWYTPEQALDAGLITGIIPAGRTPAPAGAGAAAAGAGIQASAQQHPQAAVPLGDGWVQDPDGTVRFDPDGDGDDDSTPEGDTDHDYWAADGTPLQPVPPCPAMPAARAEPGVNAAGARHEPIAGAHSHPHPAYGSQGGDAMHSHMHEHAMDASHDHAHGGGDDTGGDGSQDSAAAAIRAHFGLTDEQAQALPEAERALLLASLGGPGHRILAADADGSPWDAARAWASGAASDDPAAFYSGICAGKKAGDPATQAAHALPHHYQPSGPPNAAGVRNSLSRLPQTQGLTNEAAAKSHLQAHMKAINPDWEPSDTAAPQPEGGAGGLPQARNPSPPTPATAQSAAPGSTGPHPHPDGHAVQEGNTVTTMSIEDRAARRGEIEARLTEIGGEHGDREFPEPVQAEWDTLTAELDGHAQLLARHEEGIKARRERLGAIAARQQGERVDGGAAGYTAPDGGTDGAQAPGRVPPAYRGPQNRAPGSPALTHGRTDTSIYDLDDLRKRSRSAEEMVALCRDNALHAVERAVFPGSPDRERAQATVERLLARVPDENGTLAKRILATGNPVYARAWGRAVARVSTSVLTQDEIMALSLGTGSDGGFAVPFELDPTIILTSDSAISPLRAISRVVQITGKEYDLVTSTGITVTRSAEASAVPENNPTLAQPTIKAERVTGFIPFSVEVEQDWQAMQSEMMMLLADAKDVEECSSFTLGDGTGTNASGIIGTLSSGSNVSGTGGSGALAAEDLDALENAAAPRFRPRAVWMASKTAYNAYRALLAAQASSAGDDWARPSEGQPPRLRGYAAYENSEMTTAHTTGSKVIILGDFGRGFLIVDRLGMSVELVPHLVDQATARPTGERGILAIWRNNSRVIIDRAFTLLVVA